MLVAGVLKVAWGSLRVSAEHMFADKDKVFSKPEAIRRDGKSKKEKESESLIPY